MFVAVVLAAMEAFVLIGAVGTDRSALFTRRVSTFGFCNRGEMSCLTTAGLLIVEDVSVGFSTDAIGC